MSAIDKYKHQQLGFIECSASFDFVFNSSTRRIALYQLLEDIPIEESDFDGKTGDIIFGGGSGEAPAFRISMPEAMYFFTKDDWDGFETYANLFKAFWTPTQSYHLCEGFSKNGWSPNSEIEFWLAENICSILIDKIDHYSIYSTALLANSSLSYLPQGSD